MNNICTCIPFLMTSLQSCRALSLRGPFSGLFSFSSTCPSGCVLQLSWSTAERLAALIRSSSLSNDFEFLLQAWLLHQCSFSEAELKPGQHIIDRELDCNAKWVLHPHEQQTRPPRRSYQSCLMHNTEFWKCIDFTIKYCTWMFNSLNHIPLKVFGTEEKK